jgi:hypothetical protein
LMGPTSTAAQFAQALKHFDFWVGQGALAT